MIADGRPDEAKSLLDSAAGQLNGSPQGFLQVELGKLARTGGDRQEALTHFRLARERVTDEALRSWLDTSIRELESELAGP